MIGPIRDQGLVPGTMLETRPAPARHRLDGDGASCPQWAGRRSGRGVRTFLLLLVVPALLALATPAHAQADPAVREGSSVRLTLQPERAGEGRHQELRGTVVAVSADTIRLRVHAYVDPVSVPTGWISRLQVSLGPASRWQAAAEGAASGFLVGAAFGSVVGAEVAATTDEPFLRTVLVRAAAYGFSLGATSAAVRAVQPGERWRTVPAGALVAPDPEDGTLSLGVRIAW